MRSLTFLTILLIILTAAVPTYADEAADYILNDVAEWTEIAEGNDFNILGTYTGRIGSSGMIYSFDLAPGVYHFYSSGGKNIDDLDLALYDKDGFELNSDAMIDKIPIVVVKLDERTELEAEITAWSFKPGYNSGLFCLLLTSEDEGEVYDFSGQTIRLDGSVLPDVELPALSGQYYDDLLTETELWIPFEADEGRDVYQHEIVPAVDLGHSMSLELQSGFYTIYAQPDSRCGDLDISVYDQDWLYIAENHMDDNFPECSFYLASPQTVYIEFEIFEFAGNNTGCLLAYMVSYIEEIDSGLMSKYIHDQLDVLRESYSIGGYELVDSGFEMLSVDDEIYVFEIELDAGNYTIEADGGMVITDLDMAVLDDKESLLGEDTLPDNYPIVDFELKKSQVITIEISVYQFAEGYTEDYFCWALASY